MIAIELLVLGAILAAIATVIHLALQEILAGPMATVLSWIRLTLILLATGSLVGNLCFVGSSPAWFYIDLAVVFVGWGCWITTFFVSSISPAEPPGTRSPA